MDILLINSPIPLIRTRNTEIIRKSQPHFGLAQLATNLHKAGYKVGIVDAYPFCLSEKRILKYVKELEPKIIGLSTYTIALRELYSLINKLKEFKDIEIILGGWHISAQPELLKVINLKYALFGEADYSIIDLCNYILHNQGDIKDINGLIYNDNGNLIINRYQPLKDLDSLPLPSYKYYLTKVETPVVYLISSRGCNFHCTFCSRYDYREMMTFRSPELVVEDARVMQNLYQPQFIIFTDENFTTDRDRTIKICNLMKKENLNIKWGCLTRIDCIDEELLKIMANSGLKTLLLGIEAGSEKIRFKLGKPFKDEDCKRIVNLCRKLGVITTAFFMLALPDETMDDINQTIKFARDLATDHVYFNTYIMCPACSLYKRLKREGIVDDNTWFDYMQGKRDFPLYIPPYLTKDELLAIEIKAHRKFYINWKLLKNPFDIQRLQICGLILQDSLEREIITPIVNKIKYYLKMFKNMYKGGKYSLLT